MPQLRNRLRHYLASVRSQVATALVAAVITSALTACAPRVEAPSEAQLTQHAEEVRQWQAERDERLRQPDSWLSLVGLAWLDLGENKVGSGDDSIVMLPASAPAATGVIHGAEDGWRFAAADGVTVQVGDEEVTSVAMTTDADGVPTVVNLGAISFYLIDRQGRVGVRIRDSESEGLQSFTGVDRYPADWSWRVVADYVPYQPPKPFPVPTVLGTTLQQESPGAVEFERDGKTYRIDVLPADDEVWLIFGDATNGDSTYGGGRFLYAKLETGGADQAGPMIVDFNLAYNPPCAFSPYATCPLPPSGNVLDLAIEAGEQSSDDH